MRWWRSAAEPRWPDWLTARPYAHRGVHGGGIIENSRAAFDAAIARKLGIELDVRPDRNGTPYVFHDASLERLCGTDGKLADLDRTVRLSGTDETIPTLEEILRLVAARVPILVEVKSDGDIDENFWEQLRDLLEDYAGPAAVMSFDPQLVKWFAAQAPDVTRGLVISDKGKSKIKGLIERRLGVTISKPDFLAYDIRSLPSSFAGRWRRSGKPVLTWTVRDAAAAAIADEHADQVIREDAA